MEHHSKRYYYFPPRGCARARANYFAIVARMLMGGIFYHFSTGEISTRAQGASSEAGVAESDALSILCLPSIRIFERIDSRSCPSWNSMTFDSADTCEPSPARRRELLDGVGVSAGGSINRRDAIVECERVSRPLVELHAAARIVMRITIATGIDPQAISQRRRRYMPALSSCLPRIQFTFRQCRLSLGRCEHKLDAACLSPSCGDHLLPTCNYGRFHRTLKSVARS